MAKQVFNLGTVTNDGNGDPLYLVLKKLNISFTELYDFLAGATESKSLPTALPVSRGGTGATTASQAITSLGLSKAATTTVGLNEGNLLTVGSFNIGVDTPSSAREVDETTVAARKAGEYIYYTDTNRSVLTFGGLLSNNRGQIGLSVQDPPSLALRATQNSTYGKWRKVFSEGNAYVTCNGFIRDAKYTAQVTDSAVTTGVPEVTLTKTNTGAYSLLNIALDSDTWTLECPRNDFGDLLCKATVSQSGNTIQLRVTATDGVTPMDIPSGRWLDIRVKPYS